MTRKFPKKRRRFVPGFQSLENRCMLVGEVLELFLTPLKDGSVLPVDADGDYQAEVGDIINLEVAYNDFRFANGALGAFQLLTNVQTTNPGVFIPLLKETQRLEIDEAFNAPGGGSLTFSLEGSSTTTTVTQDDFFNRGVFELSQALVVLGFDPADFRIRNLSHGNGIVLEVVFVGDQFLNTDVSNLTVQVNSSTSISASVIETPPLNPDGSPNGAALGNSLDNRSRNFTNTAGVSNSEFITRGFGTFSSVTGEFTGVGGQGPIVTGGVPALSQNGILVEPFAFFSIPVMITAPAENVVFSVEPNSDAEAVLLYGSPSVVPQDLVLLSSGSQFRIDFASSLQTNPVIPEDVNGDGAVSLLDALDVLIKLRDDVGTSPFYDVNGDGLLTTADPHQVLNKLFVLNDGTLDTTTGNLLAYRLNAKDLNGNDLLDAERNLSLTTGDEFFVELAYDDLRPEVSRLGAFALFADLSVSNFNVIDVDIVPSFAENLIAAPQYTVGTGVSFNASANETFDELGVIGPLSSNGVDVGTTTRQALRFRVRATQPAENVVFELGHPETTEVLLYGRAGVVEPSQMVFGDASRFTVTIAAPRAIASDDQFSIVEDSGAATLNVLVNDFLPEGSATSVSIVSNPSLGTVTVNANHSLEYTPLANAAGVDTFTYQITSVLGSTTTQSIATVTVTISPVNDPPVALPDLLQVDPGQVFEDDLFDALLINDSPGPGENGQAISVTSVSTPSTEGGTVAILNGKLIYTPPAGFSGIDTFNYQIEDNDGLTSTGTVTMDVNYIFEAIEFELSQIAANDVTIRRANENVQVIDNSDGGFLLDRPIDSVESLTIVGAESFIDRIHVDHLSGGLVHFSIFIDGGESVGDQVVISGTGDSTGDFLHLTDDISGESLASVLSGELNSTHFIHDFESIAFQDMLQILLPINTLNVGHHELSISASTPIALPSLTLLDGGTLRSASPLAIAPGRSLLASGTIDARVAADVGSLIRATGELTLGDATSPAGFVTSGDLEINGNTVTVLDADQAVLGSLTTLGAGTDAGTLNSESGLIVNFGGTLTGFGTVESANDIDSAFLNNSSIVGVSSDQPITLTGFIKGVGSLDQVTIDGTASPGFSPAITRHGHVVIGAAGRLLAELGGSVVGSGYDQLQFDPQAILGGLLDVELINDFVPAVGDVYDLLLATEGLLGEFSSIDLPGLTEGLSWIIERVSDRLSLGVELDVESLAGTVTIDIVDGQLVVRSRAGNVIPARGNSLSIRATPQSQLDTQERWEVQTTELVDGERVQVATNGSITLRVTGGGWTNFVAPSDIDGSGTTSALDALTIISELNLAAFSDRFSATLVNPNTEALFPNLFYDANGDGRVTASDALLVINRLFLQDLEAASGEEMSLASTIGPRLSDVLGVVSHEIDEPINEPSPLAVHDAHKSDQVLADWDETTATAKIDLDWCNPENEDQSTDAASTIELFDERMF